MYDFEVVDYIYGLAVFSICMYVGYILKFNKQYAIVIIVLGVILSTIQVVAINVSGSPLGFTGSGKLLAGIGMLISGVITYVGSILTNPSFRRK